MPFMTKNDNRNNQIAKLEGRTILLVNTGSIKKRFIVQKLKKMGLKIIALNREKNWAQPYIDYWIIADNTNHQEALLAVKEFITANSKIKIDGAVTFWEDDVLLTSKIVDKFNFIGIPFNISQKVRNKFLFREFCEKNKLPAPKHTFIHSLIDVEKIANEFNFPLVIKPVFGASSAYVIKAENKEELLNAYDYIKKNISTNAESSLTEGFDVFIEEYIEGDEVDVDIILQNGKIKFSSISDNYQTEEPFFVETGQSIPSTLSEKNQADLLDMAEETLEKLGVQNGIIHFEAKSTKHGPVPIEINLRMGGDYVYSYIKDCWGVDLIENAVKIAFGEYIKIKKPDHPLKYVIGQDFRADHSGVLLNLELPENVKKLPFVEELHFYKEIGDPIFVPPQGYDNLGWITVSGYNLLDAQDNLKEVTKLIKYEIAKFAPESSIGKTSRKNRFSYASLNPSSFMQAGKIERIRRTTQEDQRKLHIGIACNIYESLGENSVEGYLMSVGKNIEKTLNKCGYRTTFFDFNYADKAFTALRSSDVDLVFNVCERINNSSLLEPHAAALLDILQIPYTGSNPFTLSLCIDKIRVKKLLTYHNIPTPKWDYLYTLNDEINEELKYPLIVKPANTDNSIGITNESVVTNKEELQKQLDKVINILHSPALVEEYIEGDEYDVSILGSEEDDLRVLPLSRSIFEKMPRGYWHIFTHDAKYAGDPAYKNIIVQRPAKNISKKLEALISEIALDTYNILDCHDYGRVEIRVDENDNPYVLELNPNPSINMGNCVPEVAKLVGMEYGDFLEELIRMAIKRYKNKPPYYHLQSNLM